MVCLRANKSRNGFADILDRLVVHISHIRSNVTNERSGVYTYVADEEVSSCFAY
jgi:hypothetical protein